MLIPTLDKWDIIIHSLSSNKIIRDIKVAVRNPKLVFNESL